MRKTLWLALALILVPVTPCFADSLSISAWSQGNSLSATNLNLRHTEIQNVVNGLLDSSNLKAAAAIKGSQLDLSDGSGRLVQSATLTTDQRMFQSTPTWNGSTITFEAWFLNPTDTASASESLLMDLQLGGTSKFSIGKGTATRISGSGELPFIVASGPTLTFTGTTNISWQRFFRIDSPIITNTSAMTITDAATVYIASGPRCQGNVTCTNGYALWADNGTTRLDGALTVGSPTSAAGQAYIKSAAAGTIGLVVDTAAAPTAYTQDWRKNGTVTAYLSDVNSPTIFQLNAKDSGNNEQGQQISIGRNTSAGAVGPSAGVLVLQEADAGWDYIWSDATGKLRIHTTAPTGSSGAPTVSDTAGTVVGDQTSWHEAKEILGPTRISPATALAAFVTRIIYDFRYREPSYRDADDEPTKFVGIVGFDRRDAFLKNVGRQQMPSLNEINLHGYTILAIQELARRITALERVVVSGGTGYRVLRVPN